MNEMYALLGVGLCLLLFLLVMLGIGSMAGGDWETIAQGVTLFFAIVVAFCFGAFVLAKLLEGR